MRINIASSGGRSHLLDLARELEKHGHDVRFYSFVPDKRAVSFGLKKECNKSYFFMAIPFLVLLKLSNRSHWALYLFHRFFDYYVSIKMLPCDIFIGHSPMHVYALKYAKRKYNATIILERGTSHVLTQIKVLKLNPALEGKSPMPQKFIKRDLLGYELADFISIPSDHVRQGFLKNNIASEKLIINPYGVSLSQFEATTLNKEDVFDLIIVGQWSFRKGADLLIEVCRKMKNIRLLHVGSIIDIKFPEDENMVHIDSVHQSELINFYKKAKVFVLPSREEGLALVQPQAVLCGLPLVCSKYTGGRDLKTLIDDPKWIIEFDDLNIESLTLGIKKGIALADTQKGLRSYSSDVEDNLTWTAYGNRYNTFITEKIG